MDVLRRWFVTHVPLAMLAAPLAVEAQGAKTPRIGLLGLSSASSAAPVVHAFRASLRELGYVEGRTITIDARWAEGRVERLRELAAELARLEVDVIFAAGGAQPALAAKNATRAIPVVMVTVADPVAFGLVESLSRPGGNITGVSSAPGPELQGKRLELLKEAFPKVSRVAILWSPDNPGSVVNKRATEAPARSLSITLQSLEVRNAGELEQAFSTMTRERAEALVTINSPFIVSHLKRIVDLAAKSRLPAIYWESRWADAGGLMSYGPSYPDLYRRAAVYVDKILKGAKPAELPVEQPTKFELVVNVKTAKALGLTIPPSLLLRADQVLE